MDRLLHRNSGSEQERDEWSSLIRQAKSQLLISLNVTHPNSTLTSSTSTNHLRRSLQALPFPPSDARIATVRGSPLDGRKKGKAKGSSNVLQERRSKVEHWVPAIWIPDEKTEGCMRCGRTFGWRRRRHHCRLCGRCVCAACSSRASTIIPLFHLGLIASAYRHFSSLIQLQKTGQVNLPVLVTRVTRPYFHCSTLHRRARTR